MLYFTNEKSECDFICLMMTQLAGSYLLYVSYKDNYFLEY